MLRSLTMYMQIVWEKKKQNYKSSKIKMQADCKLSLTCVLQTLEEPGLPWFYR